MKVRGQITIHNVRDGETAEFYRLKVVREEAIVKADGVLKGTFSYSIEYVKGSLTTIKNGNKTELYVTCRPNTNVNVPITLGAINSGTFTLNEYIKAANRPDYFIVELKKGNEVVETRSVQVMMEAASYTKIVNDMRESVSTNGRDITTIKQTANSMSATITSLKNGLVEVGFELDGDKKSFTVTAENFKVQTSSGEVALMTSKGKVNAELIDAKEVRTTPSDSGLHIEMYEGTFDILTKGNKKGISMTVDKDGFPHLIFFDTEGNAKYDLGYTGLKELVSAYRAAYWTTSVFVNVTDKGLSAVYPRTGKGKTWHQYHAAYHYATGDLGENAKDDGKYFETEGFGALIPDGWYTVENMEGNFVAEESILESGEKPKRIYSVLIQKFEGGLIKKSGNVRFIVRDRAVNFCDAEGKLVPVQNGYLQNYPFDNSL